MAAVWTDKSRAMLGLCMRSGSCVSGDTQVEAAIRKNKAKIVILSDQASKNTLDKYTHLCDKKHILMVNGPDKETLGGAIGKGSRTLVAITDRHWAKTMLDTMGVLR
jgi:ribosomal protein L7Ae-like RNA K-turn-binding protein